MVQETKTRSEQYMDALNRARNALGANDLESALQCINAAIWVELDMEREATQVFC